MRIGLNLMYLVPGEVGGTETYARELILELARLREDDEFVVFCGREAADELPDPRWPENVRVHGLNVNCRSKPLRVAAEIFRLPRIARKQRVELLHSLGGTTPFHGAFARVVTIHDLIFHHFPETFPAAARRGLEFLVPRGARRAERVITVSEASARDIVKTYGIDRAKIDVTLEAGLPVGTDAADIGELRSQLSLGDSPYVLCVASTIAHKNIARLLEAFREVDGEAKLVLTGHAGLAQTSLERLVEDLGLTDRVRFTGWVSRAELEGLYRGATAFVYPTLIEGFGLPVLEAMQRGVPVACSNTSSLPEVAGDAALLFDPHDVAAIASAIDRMLGESDLRSELIDRGHARAAEFSWQRCARETAESFDRALAQRN